VGEAGREVAAADVVKLLAENGIEASPNAVRNHLARLQEKGELIRVGDRYAIPARTGYIPATAAGDFPTSPTDDDIPF
jgi:hypothetical protein